MDTVDYRYVSILGTRLEGFQLKNISPYKANFRCPICGDSKKSKSKTRGWLLEKGANVFFHCFNCGESHILRFFLREYDINLYNEYVTDTFLDKKTYAMAQDHQPKKKAETPEVLKGLLRLDKMPPSHPARLYVEERKIPAAAYHRMFYTPKFNAYVNSLIPKKMKEDNDEPRLILPMFKENGMVMGFQGRSFKPDGIRYITIMLSDDEKAFGLEQVNWKRRYIVVEGPIDSLFLENCIAMAGSDIKLDSLKDIENAVFVFDNEPRNKQIVKKMEDLIALGHSVCLWPKSRKEKDINDMILAGSSPSEIRKEIFENRTKGRLQGELKISAWKAV